MTEHCGDWMTEHYCGMCGRAIDFAGGEGLHYPCWWGCHGDLRRLRQEHRDSPICVDCLPRQFKTGGPGWRPMLSAADLPKVGEPLPPSTIARKP